MGGTPAITSSIPIDLTLLECDSATSSTSCNENSTLSYNNFMDTEPDGVVGFGSYTWYTPVQPTFSISFDEFNVIQSTSCTVPNLDDKFLFLLDGETYAGELNFSICDTNPWFGERVRDVFPNGDIQVYWARQDNGIEGDMITSFTSNDIDNGITGAGVHFLDTTALVGENSLKNQLAGAVGLTTSNLGGVVGLVGGIIFAFGGIMWIVGVLKEAKDEKIKK
jgi:hypothetical protein